MADFCYNAMFYSYPGSVLGIGKIDWFYYGIPNEYTYKMMYL